MTASQPPSSARAHAIRLPSSLRGQTGDVVCVVQCVCVCWWVRRWAHWADVMHADAGQSRKSPVSERRTPAESTTVDRQMSSVTLAVLRVNTHRHSSSFTGCLSITLAQCLSLYVCISPSSVISMPFCLTDTARLSPWKTSVTGSDRS